MTNKQHKSLLFTKVTLKDTNVNRDDFLELKDCYESIGDTETKGSIEVERNKRAFNDRLKSILISEKIISKAAYQSDMFLISCKKSGSSFSVRISLNLECSYNWVSEENLAYLKSIPLFNKHFTEIEERLKQGQSTVVFNLKRQLKEQEELIKDLQKELGSAPNYSRISFTNLNDLNSAKFLDEDEKRMILGLKPRVKGVNNDK